MEQSYINRIRIEGGFLDGLDLPLEQGLNVIIGGRGTGKSSLVELLRYCLRGIGHTEESQSRSLAHAQSVLGDGQVTVSITSGDETFPIVRSSTHDNRLDIKECKPHPLFFSQTEIEHIGLSHAGRMSLLDAFVDELEELQTQEAVAEQKVKTISLEIASSYKRNSDFEDRLVGYSNIDKEVEEHEQYEKSLLKASEELTILSKILSNHENQIAKYKQEYTALDDLFTQLNQVSQMLNTASGVSFAWDGITPKDSATELSFIDNMRKEAARCITKVDQAVVGIGWIIEQIENKQTELRKATLNEESASQTLRLKLDKIKSGTGEAARKGQQLRTKKKERQAIKTLIEKTKKNLSELIEEREQALDELDSIRRRRAEKRLAAVNQLNADLAPQLKISLHEASYTENYHSTLNELFYSSGFKYKELTPVISEMLSPRQLVRIIDSHDVEEFIEAVPISKDRAGKILYYLRENESGRIATVQLDDDVRFMLLDGVHYKDFSELSTGQRCTVVLPIVLLHTKTILVIDQPEDHIDNAFVTSTLINAIQKRANQTQLIIATHNANIPILGEAVRVVHLGSNGVRGFIRSTGELSEHTIVNGISDIMEGGKVAFSKRAQFYKGTDDGL